MEFVFKINLAMEDLKERINTESNETNAHPSNTAPINTTSKKPAGFKRPILLYLIIGIVEILLLFRFTFKLTGADATSGFVGFIYNVTNFLVAPYSYFIFEPGTLIAMFVYAIIAWGIAKIIIITGDRRRNKK